jgi:hypothetical protein
MAELFSAYSQFKPYIGGRINQTVELTSLEPTIYETARRHLVPWLGSTFYNDLVIAAAGSPTTAQSNLLPYVRRALALLTVYEYSKVASVEMGESGMHRVESESRKAAFRYQEKAYQNDAREKGYDALEEMLQYLDTNAATYTTWRDSDEGKLHRETILNYSKHFRLHTDHAIDRYSYEALRPLITNQQRFNCQQALPVSFWSGFISRHAAGTLTSAEKIIRDYMRLAIAYGALEEARTMHILTIREGRVYVQEEFGEQSNTNKTLPSAGAAGLQSFALYADRYRNMWVSYIMANPSSFPTVFDTASGGSNTATDAWHINTSEEEQESTNDRTARLDSAVYQL